MIRAIALAAALVAACAPAGPPPAPDRPASLGPRRVTVGGNLQAVVATPIAIPDIDGYWGALVLAWLAPDGTTVREGEVVARLDRTAAENTLVEAEANLATTEAQLRQARVRATASALDSDVGAKMAAREAEQTKRFRAKDPMVFSKNQIIEAELDEHLATARSEQAESARRSDILVSGSSIELAAIELRRAETVVSVAKSALEHLEIRAPHAGLFVLHRDDHGEPPKLGARMWSGQQIGELPKLDEMEAQLFVLEADAIGLEVGRAVDVTVASHPDAPIHGTIKTVDKLAKPRDLGIPTLYFGVTVALPHAEHEKLGQRARATLTLENRK